MNSRMPPSKGKPSLHRAIPNVMSVTPSADLVSHLDNAEDHPVGVENLLPISERLTREEWARSIPLAD
jgi:hypothetical protein